MEGVVDTNVLISAIVKEDVNHGIAREILEGMEKWYIPSIVFHEIVWFLKAERIDAKIVEKILKNEKTQFVPIEEEDLVFSLENIESLRDYNDFLILSVSIRKNKILVTFDEDLKKNSKKFNVKVYP